jgi:hypothetical protein
LVNSLDYDEKCMKCIPEIVNSLYISKCYASREERRERVSDFTYAVAALQNTKARVRKEFVNDRQ